MLNEENLATLYDVEFQNVEQQNVEQQNVK
jgi:hypothetical protein